MKFKCNDFKMVLIFLDYILQLKNKIIQYQNIANLFKKKFI